MALHKLNANSVRSAARKGRHSDGGGLYLVVTPSETKNWSFVWSRNGKKREMGLGAYPAIPLAGAREKASALRSALAVGNDPLRERAKRVGIKTFSDAVGDFLKEHEKQWKNEKHRAQWRMTLGEAYCKSILHKPVSQIYFEDILAILRPIWDEKPETAQRLRGRIERVLSYARVHGWRSGDNPALWKGNLENALPAGKKLKKGHHKAMKIAKLPEFWQCLSGKHVVSAYALQLLILTGARTGEVIGSRWDEFDLEKAVWTVPSGRMKGNKLHRVPLSDEAMKILNKLNSDKTSDVVFEGQKVGKQISSTALRKLLLELVDEPVTIHGFRSSFRDWVSECTNFPEHLAELSLSHRVGSDVERAYRRGDQLEKRRVLMQAWADTFKTGTKT